MSLGELHKILKSANSRTLWTGQGGRFSLYNGRRFVQQGLELRVVPGSHAQVVYRPEQVYVLVGEEEDVARGRHIGEDGPSYASPSCWSIQLQ